MSFDNFQKIEMIKRIDRLQTELNLLFDKINRMTNANSTATTQSSSHTHPQYALSSELGSPFDQDLNTTNSPTFVAVTTDTINEKTATAGVTIDGLLVKDSGIPEAAVTAHEAAIDHNALTNYAASRHLSITYGALAGQPAAGTAGNIYIATDTFEIYLDNGVTWDQVSTMDYDDLSNPIVSSDIDHDATTNFASGEHFTMLDEDNMATNSATQAATQQSIKAYVDAACMIGASNLAEVPLMPISSLDYGAGDEANFGPSSTGVMTNINTGGINLYYLLMLPTSRGGLSLYVDDIIIGLLDADSDDYIDAVYLLGVKYDGATAATTIDSDLTNITTTGKKTIARTASDVSAYQQIWVRIVTSDAAELDLDIQGVWLGCYYG